MKLTPEEREEIKRIAKELNSDGCSKVSEIHQICCLEHDIPYRTGKDFRGNEVTKRATDSRFRKCLQEESKLGKFSPLSYWRWFGVAIINFNGGYWNKKSK